MDNENCNFFSLVSIFKVVLLKSEMDAVTGEVQAQKEGFKKLEKVDRKLSSQGGCRKEDIQDLVEEMRSIQRTLFLKEQEKSDLIQALLRLKGHLSHPDASSEVRENVYYCFEFASVMRSVQVWLCSCQILGKGINAQGTYRSKTFPRTVIS